MDSQRDSTVSTAASAATEPASPASPRKPYRRPRLVLWGDLRDVTLGPSPGVGESGTPGMFKP